MGRADNLFLLLILRGKNPASLRIRLAASCSWMVFHRLSSFPLRVFIMKEWYCYYTKTQLFCFPFFLPLSILPFVISFQSLVGHQDYNRKEEAMGCCASTPWSAVSSICHPSLLSALLICDDLVVWHKLHPSTLICSSGPLSPGSGALGFLSLSFRVQIPFLSLPRSPRLLWQLLVSGQLKAIFQMAKFSFHSCTSMIPQIFYENFLMPIIVLVWYW